MLRIAGFRADRIRALVNVAVLTTGFDVPDVDLIALARNTQSPVPVSYTHLTLPTN